ncbi:zinc ribbon domain-containing protein [Halostagnicola sp. A56]|uniref:zinc ribbon domain-containing protein n=1 Tax=Halostagnicola sp. A56 TaxID=1495067 RepID=UPI0004A17287|nr:zinc ribbon domain-containing protein [Halostagnicola sp. A56]
MPFDERDGPAVTTGPDEQYCSSCGDVIKREAEICPHCGVRQKYPQEKNPGIAAVLSVFVTGVGQIYNGQVGKGLALMVIQFINALLVFVVVGIFTGFIVWVYAIYDAYSVAEKINRGEIEP